MRSVLILFFSHFLLFCLYRFYVLLQVRVKHMLSQGSIEQSSFSSGYNRSNSANSGRILETNTENLLRMVHGSVFMLLFLESYYHSCMIHICPKSNYGNCFRSVIVKMMLIVDVFYSLFILEKNLILQPAKKHVTIVWRSKVLLRRMSLRLQSSWYETIIIIVGLFQHK